MTDTAPDFAPEYTNPPEVPEYAVNTTDTSTHPATVDVPDDTEVQAVAEALREILANDVPRTGETFSVIEQAAGLLEALSA